MHELRTSMNWNNAPIQNTRNWSRSSLNVEQEWNQWQTWRIWIGEEKVLDILEKVNRETREKNEQWTELFYFCNTLWIIDTMSIYRCSLLLDVIETGSYT